MKKVFFFSFVFDCGSCLCVCLLARVCHGRMLLIKYKEEKLRNGDTQTWRIWVRPNFINRHARSIYWWAKRQKFQELSYNFCRFRSASVINTTYIYYVLYIWSMTWSSAGEFWLRIFPKFSSYSHTSTENNDKSNRPGKKKHHMTAIYTYLWINI